MTMNTREAHEVIAQATFNVVYLWKLELAEGKDEVLVKLIIKNDKVGGFWLQ